jgi:RNA-binding protein YhbY
MEERVQRCLDLYDEAREKMDRNFYSARLAIGDGGVEALTGALSSIDDAVKELERVKVALLSTASEADLMLLKKGVKNSSPN